MATLYTLLFLAIFNPLIMGFLHGMLALVWPQQWRILGIDVNATVELGLFGALFFVVLRRIQRSYYRSHPIEVLDEMERSTRPFWGTAILALLFSGLSLLVTVALDLSLIWKNLLSFGNVDLGYLKHYMTYAWILLTIAAALDWLIGSSVKSSKDDASPAVLPGKERENASPNPEGLGDREVKLCEYKWEFKPHPETCFGQGDSHEVRLLADMPNYQELKLRDRVERTRWANEYVAGGISAEVLVATRELEEIARSSRYNYVTGINNVLAWVSLHTHETSEEETGQSKHPRYPLETIVDRRGNSVDKVVLAAAVLNAMGYDTVLLLTGDHMSIGVGGAEGVPGLEGSYFTHKGKRYFYCEASEEGWRMGELPSGIERVRVQEVPA